jgi:hypothetical protein
MFDDAGCQAKPDLNCSSPHRMIFNSVESGQRFAAERI